MKGLLIGLLVLGSVSAFAEINCTTSNGEVLNVTIGRSDKPEFLLERSLGSSVGVNLINNDELVHIISSDEKTAKISFSRQSHLGTAKLDNKLVLVECEVK